jgi:hypothetical protein
MKHIALAAALLAFAGTTLAAGSHNVRGHVRKDGTYVQPHKQTNPDRSRTNNWSSQGNLNPYTGKEGTVDPYAPKPPRKGY